MPGIDDCHVPTIEKSMITNIGGDECIGAGPIRLSDQV
jgi:hypothetical protein